MRDCSKQYELNQDQNHVLIFFLSKNHLYTLKIQFVEYKRPKQEEIADVLLFIGLTKGSLINLI